MTASTAGDAGAVRGGVVAEEAKETHDRLVWTVAERLEACEERMSDLLNSQDRAWLKLGARILRDSTASARWEDGEPKNLAAAVEDAAEWLDLFSRRADILSRQDHRDRCRGALANLRKFSAAHDQQQLRAESHPEGTP